MRIMLGPHKAFIHQHNRTIAISLPDEAVKFIEGLLIPPEARHNFSTLEAYNKAAAEAVQITQPEILIHTLTCTKAR